MSGRSRNCAECDRKIIGLQDSEICNNCDLRLDKRYRGARHLPAGPNHPRTIEQERLRQLDRRLAGLPDDSHRLMSIDLPEKNPNPPSDRYEADAETLSRSRRMSYRGRMRTYVDDYGFTREEAKQNLNKEREFYESELEEIAASEEEIYQGKLRRRRYHERRTEAQSVSDSREAGSDLESIVNLDQLPERPEVRDLSKLSPLAKSTHYHNYRRNKHRYREYLKRYQEHHATREEAKNRLLEDDVYVSDIEVHDASEDEEYRANRRQQRNYERAKAAAEAERSEAGESGATIGLLNGDDDGGDSVMTEEQGRGPANSIASSAESSILDLNASYATKEKRYLSRLRLYMERGHSREEAKKLLFQERAEYGSDFQAIAAGEVMAHEAAGLVARSGFCGGDGLRGGGGEDDYVDDDGDSVVVDEQGSSSNAATRSLRVCTTNRRDTYVDREGTYLMWMGIYIQQGKTREEALARLHQDSEKYGSDFEVIAAKEEKIYREAREKRMQRADPDEQQRDSANTMVQARHSLYKSRRVAYRLYMNDSRRLSGYARAEAKKSLRVDPMYGSDLEDIAASEEDDYQARGRPGDYRGNPAATQRSIASTFPGYFGY